MKRKLLLLSLVATMFVTGCKENVDENKDNQQNNTTENGENTNQGNPEDNNQGQESNQGNENQGNENQGNENQGNENQGNENQENQNQEENGNGEGEIVHPPIIVKNNFETALQKNYKNMTVAFALNSTDYGQEYGHEYYAGENDFVAVLDGNTAEMYGSSYAWSFYSNFEGKNYAYWKGSGYVTEGWISNGSKGTPVGIDYAYFYMPYFLNSITVDDVTNVMGAYVVKSDSIAKVLEGLKFTYVSNKITYVDISVNTEGYISRIRGYDDPNNDEYGFQLEFSGFGSTKIPTSITIPPEIGHDTIKTYVEMIGHEEIPDIYMTDMTLVINDTVVSDDTYDIIIYPDDVVDLSYTYNPSNANKREINWISTNEDAAIMIYAQQSGHQYIRAVNPGETEVYITHVNEYKEVISSRKLKVMVREPKQVEESAADVYRFAFTGYSGEDGNYTIGAVNTVSGSNAPFTIKSWRMKTRTGENTSHFDEDDILLYSDAANSDQFTERFEDEVIFDFENQQVNKISFKYGLYWDNNSSVVLGNFESATLSTSNDGVDWKDIDISDEFRTEFAKTSGSIGMTPKVLTREFLPASMVKLVIKAKNVGGNGLGLGMENFVFSKDENCRNYDDVDAVPVTSIEINAPKSKVKIGTSMKFDYHVLPTHASNQKVRWVSDNPQVLKIDSRTGAATGLKAGVAYITAISTSNSSMESNSFEVTVYEQEEIYDPNNFLVGKTFAAEGVMSGSNVFDVSFYFANKTSALLTLTSIIAGMSFDNKITASYEEFDALTNIYTFSVDNGEICVAVSADGETVELTFVKGNTYLLGNESQGVTLRKVA